MVLLLQTSKTGLPRYRFFFPLYWGRVTSVQFRLRAEPICLQSKTNRCDVRSVSVFVMLKKYEKLFDGTFRVWEWTKFRIKEQKWENNEKGMETFRMWLFIVFSSFRTDDADCHQKDVHIAKEARSIWTNWQCKNYNFENIVDIRQAIYVPQINVQKLKFKRIQKSVTGHCSRPKKLYNIICSTMRHGSFVFRAVLDFRGSLLKFIMCNCPLWYLFIFLHMLGFSIQITYCNITRNKWNKIITKLIWRINLSPTIEDRLADFIK